MRYLAFALAAVAAAAPATADQMEDACLARGVWDGETCACIQGVADEILDPDQQDMAAAFFAGQTTSQQIAARHGVAVAQDFLGSLAAFMEQSTSTCGAP